MRFVPLAGGATLVAVAATAGNEPGLAHTALYVGLAAIAAWIGLRPPLIL
jgi:hypothetical protein